MNNLLAQDQTLKFESTDGIIHEPPADLRPTITGIWIGGIIAVALLVLIFFIWRKKMKKKS